jgi:hypothetical protein
MGSIGDYKMDPTIVVHTGIGVGAIFWVLGVFETTDVKVTKA